MIISRNGPNVRGFIIFTIRSNLDLSEDTFLLKSSVYVFVCAVLVQYMVLVVEIFWGVGAGY